MRNNICISSGSFPRCSFPVQHCARPPQRQALQEGGEGAEAAGGAAAVLRLPQGRAGQQWEGGRGEAGGVRSRVQEGQHTGQLTHFFSMSLCVDIPLFRRAAVKFSCRTFAISDTPFFYAV